jgi:hypothetical protein
MTVLINGNTGISGTNGSAGTPAVQGEDTNTGIFFPATDTVAVATAGAERLRVTSAGDVGVGTSSPVNISGYTIQTLNNTSSGAATYYQQNATTVGRVIATSSDFYVGGVKAGSNLILESAGSERARITASGDFGIGTTSPIAKLSVGVGSVVGFRVDTTTASESVIITGNLSNLQVRHPAAGLELLNSGGTAFRVVANTNGVSLAPNGTSWGAISDERLKDIIEPINDASEKVASLRAVIGKYKTDEEGTRRSFLIAQDVQAVFPEAVVQASKDDDTLLLQYTDILPLLVKAIQELTARVAQLEARQ